MVELDYGVVRPYAAATLLAEDHLAPRFEQHPEYLEGLVLKPNLPPLFAQFARPEI
jgi:hypothetical protein